MQPEPAPLTSLFFLRPRRRCGVGARGEAEERPEERTASRGASYTAAGGSISTSSGFYSSSSDSSSSIPQHQLLPHIQL